MKRLLLAALAALGAAAAVKRQQDAKNEAQLWHEATTAPDVRRPAAGESAQRTTTGP